MKLQDILDQLDATSGQVQAILGGGLLLIFIYAVLAMSHYENKAVVERFQFLILGTLGMMVLVGVGAYYG